MPRSLLTFSVEQEHIDQAFDLAKTVSYDPPSQCPIALALKTPEREVAVGQGVIAFHYPDRIQHSWMSLEVSMFMRDFDRALHFAPYPAPSPCQLTIFLD